MNPRLRRDVAFASDTKVNDEGCMETLKEYGNAAFLGNGKYGVALRVTHANDKVPVVVKIMTRADADGDEARAEITKSLQVDRVLAQSNSIFSRVHGWIACGPVKMKAWLAELANAKDLDFNPKTAKCYYLVSEYGGATAMKSLQFTLGACKQFVFELLWTLNEAFKVHGFHHNDFHPGNIVVKTNETETRYRRLSFFCSV